ncbi:MAG TPA: hypothetical protein VFZ81_09655, partial [Burkholderiales bacterium]
WTARARWQPQGAVNAADVLRTLYAVSGSALVLAYVPQILAVWRCRQGAASVSLVTWSAWSVASTISFLYAVWVVRDWSYGLVTLGSALGCYAVTALSVLKRLRHRQAPRA